MTGNVVQFPGASKATSASDASLASEASLATIVEFSPTSKLSAGIALMSAVNDRLRRKAPAKAKNCGDVREQQAARGEAWRKADVRTDFFKALLDWHHAVYIGQMYGVAEANLFASIDLAEIGERSVILERYREALGDQLLTPAPTRSAVDWKRKAGRRNHLKISDTQIDRAIADDLAWLEKYPASVRRVRRPVE
jgi:hypothetical protein